jgi:hypothetical protein
VRNRLALAHVSPAGMVGEEREKVREKRDEGEGEKGERREKRREMTDEKKTRLKKVEPCWGSVLESYLVPRCGTACGE